jgi:RES domain-containing protein
MQVYRIERQKYLPDTLKGMGAALSTGFRWNSLHTRLVYSTESRSLALLEVLVHLDLSEDLPTDRLLVAIEIPDELLVQVMTEADLAPNWHAKPPLRQTQLLGDAFVRAQEAAVLKVPSSIMPDEFNYLINPQHPAAAQIKVVGQWPLAFDGRLLVKKS